MRDEESTKARDDGRSDAEFRSVMSVVTTLSYRILLGGSPYRTKLGCSECGMAVCASALTAHLTSYAIQPSDNNNLRVVLIDCGDSEWRA